MGLTNPSLALARFLQRSTSPKLSTLSDIPPFSTNLFWQASLLAFLAGHNLSFLIGALAWFIKITEVAPFESVEVFRKDPFLALYFSLFSSMIFVLLCLLPSASFFILTIWPFGPPPRSPLRWSYTRSVDWTGALIWVPVSSSQCEQMWGFFLLSESTPSFAQLPPLFQSHSNFSWGHLRPHFFPFVNMYLRWRPSSKLVARPYDVSLPPHEAPLKSPSVFCMKLFLGPCSLMLHLDGSFS